MVMLITHNTYNVFDSRESERIDCGRRESTKTNILPMFGIIDRDERKTYFGGPHAHKAFCPKLGRKC
jgi:hypothetical protein